MINEGEHYFLEGRSKVQVKDNLNAEKERWKNSFEAILDRFKFTFVILKDNLHLKKKQRYLPIYIRFA